MRRAALLASLVAFLWAAPAWSADCSTDAGDYIRATAVGTVDATYDSWAGGSCTPDGGDDFTIDESDAVVVIDGNFTLTTGTIECSAGTLIVSPGVLVTSPVSFRITGSCLFLAEGDVMAEGRIRDEPTYGTDSGSSTTLDVDFPTTNLSATTDYLWVGDDDPEDINANLVGPVQIGPGPPRPGVHRPSYEKWKWYDLRGITDADTVVINHDELTDALSGSYTGTPWTGTLDHCRATATAVGTTTLQRFGLATRVALGALTTLGDGNCTGQYLIYDEVDPTAEGAECSGLAAKIIQLDDAGGTDLAYVLGDVTRCGTASARIVKGLRRGDPVKIVRPVQIDGSSTGYFLWDGGTVQARWVRFRRLGNLETDGVSPSMGTDCQFCVIQEAANTEPTFNGSYLSHFEIAFSTGDGTNNSAHLAISASSDHNLATARIAADPEMDVSGFVLEYGYIHDGQEDASSGSPHCIEIQNVQNLKMHRMRFERCPDDAYISNNPNGSGETFPLELRHVHSWEQATNDLDNSQDGIQITYNPAGSGTSNQGWINRNTVQLSNLSTFGTAQNSPNLGGLLGAHIRGSVFGGAIDGSLNGYGFNMQYLAPNVGCSGADAPVDECTGFFTCPTCSYPENVVSAAPSIVEDSLILDYAFRSGVAEGVSLPGICRNSLIFGNQMQGNASWSVDYLVKGEGCFIDAASLLNAAPLIMPATGGDPDANIRTDLFSLTDSVVVANNGTGALLSNYHSGSEDTSITACQLTRSSILLDEPTTGYLSGDCDDSSVTSTINGLRATMLATPDDIVLGIDSGSVANVTNSCIETTFAPADAIGSGAASSNHTSANLGPDADEGGMRLRSFVGDNLQTRCPTQARTLGLQNLSVTHAMMGDFFLMSIENFSSKDLGRGPSSSGSTY